MAAAALDTLESGVGLFATPFEHDPGGEELRGVREPCGTDPGRDCSEDNDDIVDLTEI